MVVTADEEKVDWLELPDDLLDLIMDNLTTTDHCFLSGDYIRFGSVCVSWRFAFYEHKNNPPLPQPPALGRSSSSMFISTTSYMDDDSDLYMVVDHQYDDGFDHDMEICNLEDQMAVCNLQEESNINERHFPPDVQNTSIQPFPYWITWRSNRFKQNPSSNSSEASLPKRRRI